MQPKFIKYLQITTVILIFIIYGISTYSDWELQNEQILLVILSVLYFILSGLYMFRLERYKPINSEKFFPFRSTYIGVGQWPASIIWIIYSLEVLNEGNYFMGTMLMIFYLMITAEAIVKNKKQRFNVEFQQDKIVINEEPKNEILLKDIVGVEEMNSKKIKILTKEHKDDEIMNINRIQKNLRDDFKRILLSLGDKERLSTQQSLG